MLNPTQFALAAGRPNNTPLLTGILGDSRTSGDTILRAIADKAASLPLQPQGLGSGTEGNKLWDFAKNWPVRSQHWSRGTCTAFSFTAMCEYHAMQVDVQPHEPPYSEEYLYSKMRREGKALAPPNADTGSTYLEQAIMAMQNHRLCPQTLLPNQGPQDDPAWSVKDTRELERGLTPHVLQERRAFYWRPDIKNLSDPMPFSVESLRLLMSALEVPVCISLPIYPDGEILPWTFGIGWDTGVIPEPIAGWQKIPVNELSGHSVCLVGSVLDTDAPGQGWFIFRNSWGPEFAARTPRVDKLKEFHMPGYGVISFAHVQQHCWEVAYLLPSDL